jgi:CheY-like chemotaxis protein
MVARILIIEDNETNLELMKYLLSEFGYNVETASNGKDGIKLVEKGEIDLVICDIQLSDIDGMQVAFYINSTLKN